MVGIKQAWVCSPSLSLLCYLKQVISPIPRLCSLIGINYAHPKGRLGASEHCSVYKVLLHSLGHKKMVAEGFFFLLISTV